jgi:hypothetical protein
MSDGALDPAAALAEHGRLWCSAQRAAGSNRDREVRVHAERGCVRLADAERESVVETIDELPRRCRSCSTCVHATPLWAALQSDAVSEWSDVSEVLAGD